MIASNVKNAWIVSFGGVAVHFVTEPEARRYFKSYRKQVAQRGGAFKASIKRAPYQAGGNA